MILGARAMPVSGAPWSADPADYPACKTWLRFYERPMANATALTDVIGNLTGMVVVANGTGDPDAASRGLSLSTDAGNEIYAVAPATISDALRIPGDGPIILEADIDLTSGDHSSAFIEVGDPFTATQGYALLWNSSGYPQLKARGATGAARTLNFTSAPDITGARAHVAAVWNRSAADTLGSATLYVNGVAAATGVLDGDPGAITGNVNSTCSIGARASSAISNLDGVIYNARVWVLSSMPSNIAAIMLQMGANPDEFPPLMAGLS